MRFGYWLLLASLSASFTAISAGQVVTSNLLANPGAETGNLNSWTVIVGAPFADNGTFDSGINPRTGGFDFTGGSANPLGQLNQSIDLIATGQVTALQLDAGTVTADASFWEQGLNQGSPSDNAAIQITFLDAVSTVLGTITSATIDSHTGSWANGGLSSIAVPVGTRFITYTMLFQRNAGSDNDSFVDDNSLTLTIPVPEPGSVALLFAGLPFIALAARRFRKANWHS
jgi:hypothetical protein